MKSFGGQAMLAIESGSAIVCGALEIIPRPRVFSYTTVGTVDLDAVDNATNSTANAATVGVTLTGFDPGDILRLTLPTGQTFVSWNSNPNIEHWVGEFDVVLDGVVSESLQVREGGIITSDSYSGAHLEGGYATAEEARAAFGEHFLTGAAEYTFFIYNRFISSNPGGVSILVEKRDAGGGSVGTPDPIRVWGGYGEIEIDGELYQGVGDRTAFQRTAGAIGGVAQGLVLTLSGVEPAAMELLDAEEVKGASAVVRRLIFTNSGKGAASELLDVQVFDRGRVDTVETVETIGGGAAIKLAIESAARGLGSSGARMRADSDQRLISATDGYFKNTAFAGEKMLYWGGRKPSRTSGANTAISGVFNPSAAFAG